MDLREGEAAPNTYAIGLNIDTSDGQIAARPALGIPHSDTVPFRARLHLVDRPGLDRRILAAGPVSGSNGCAIGFRVLNADSLAAVGAQQDLTAAFGEGVDLGKWTCSFVDVFLNPTAGQPRPVTLLVTPSSTYVYEPSVDAVNLRRIVTATDSFRLATLTFSYWSHAPKGPVAVTHQSRVYYAGFRETDQAWLDNPLDASQTAVPAAIIGAGRGHLDLSPASLVWSDEFDPVGIRADHFLAVEAHEAITGLHSTGEVMLIFTARSVYALSGYSDATYQLQRVTSAPGCVAHASIVSVAGTTYYAAADGIYAFGGMLAPEVVKISAGIEALWTGMATQSTHIPVPFRSTNFPGYSWPFLVDRSQNGLTVGRHYPERNQIWFSLPVVPALSNLWPRGTMPVTAVYDVESQGWNLYFARDSVRGVRTGPMCDAVNPKGRWVTSNGQGEVQELGRGNADGPTDGTNCRGIPSFWLSRRFPESSDDEITVRGLYFRQLATGSPVTGQSAPVDTLGSGAVASDLPQWAFEAESAAFDFENSEGVLVSATDWEAKRTRNGALQGYPRAASSSFLGTLVLGAGTLQPVDWFTARGDAAMTGRWFRLAFLDDGGIYPRPAYLRIASIGIDMVSTGTPRG